MVKSHITSLVTFHDVLGDVPVNPVTGGGLSWGGGLCSGVFTDITASTFSFSGFTAEFALYDLTYEAGDGFNVFEMTMGVDSYRICTFPGGGQTGGCFPGPGPFPAPEPGTLALLGLGLAGLAFTRRRKQ